MHFLDKHLMGSFVSFDSAVVGKTGEISNTILTYASRIKIDYLVGNQQLAKNIFLFTAAEESDQQFLRQDAGMLIKVEAC